MSQVWYVQLKGKTVGPMSTARLKQAAVSAEITASTRVRCGKGGEWGVAERLKGLFSGSDDGPTHTAPVKDARDAPSVAANEKSSASNPYESPTSDERHQPDASKDGSASRERGLKDALLTIWFQPRRTIRWAIDHRPGLDAIILVMVAFSLKYFDNVLSSESTSIASGLVGSVVGVPLSALIGIIVLYLFGFLHKVVGEALGGHGNHRALRTAFAWSMIPIICSFPLTILFLVLFNAFPKTLFIPDVIVNAPFLALFVWGIVIEVAGISAAHEFGVLRAIATFLLTIVLLFLFLFIASQAVFMMFA